MPEIKKNKADVINVVSIMATMFDIEQGSLSYTSSKWALRGASLNLQNELKNSPCRVMTLNIGGMKTNLFKKYNKNLSEITKDWMNPKEIAEILLYFFKLPKQIEVSEIVISRKINYK